MFSDKEASLLGCHRKMAGFVDGVSEALDATEQVTEFVEEDC